jgi:tRNA(adenine34) deaminase
MSQDEYWMQMALQEARLALNHNDVPIGAVAVRDGVIIGKGHNHREIDGDPTAHAEMIAIRQAATAIGHWRLDNVTLYCTLEPCCMCAGAMVLARLPRLVYAAIDPKAGCAGSIADILRHSKLNHQVDIDVGLLADEAGALLQDFFQNLREDE